MNSLYRNLTTRQLYALGLAIPLLCTLLIGWLQWNSVSDMLQTRQLVRHSRDVQVALGIFRYALSDSESCQFRYVLTHNPANLDAYAILLNEATDQLKKLRELTSENSYQQRVLDQIEPLFTEKVRLAAQSLEMEKSGDHENALKIVSAESSRLNMLDIESNVEVMQNNEAQLLWQRQTTYQHNFKIASGLSVLSVALCLGFVVTILMLMRQLARMQSIVTLSALTEMIKYEGGTMTIEEYLKRRHQALTTHGQAQIEAERLLALVERGKLK